MKRLILFLISVSFAVVCNAQKVNPKIWTKKYERDVFSQFENMSKSQIGDNYLRNRFCQCCVDKIKILIPNGLESVSDKRLKEITVSVANACKKQITDELVFTKWTPEIEKKLSLFFSNTYSDKSIPYNIRTGYCDCMVKNLKIEFPSGMNGNISDAIMSKVTGSCANEIAKKHPDLK